MHETFSKHVYRILLLSVVFILGLGTVVYHLVEKFPWVDAYYFSVVTLATVGYGDFVPHTTFGKIFTTFYIFAGVGLLATFLNYSLRRRAFKYDERHESKINRDKK